jgi:hypothetical protein
VDVEHPRPVPVNGSQDGRIDLGGKLETQRDLELSLDYRRLGKGGRSDRSVRADESPNAELDSPEVANHHGEHIDELGGLDLPEDWRAGRAARFAGIVDMCDDVGLSAASIRMADVSCVVILASNRGQLPFDLADRRRGSNERKKPRAFARQASRTSAR